ncbi:hypothetical protein Btru_040570 [Bulinus truncatus]|nr:hypothetical protein Btru_040570 [Bulinus truncatus]
MDRFLDETFKRRMVSFPCMFNMERSAYKDEKEFKAKLETLLEEDDIQTDVRKMNFITWLQFTLDNFRGEKKHESAMSWNEKAVKMSKGNELVSLANKVYLLKYLGDEIISDKYFHLLESKKSDPNFRLFLADAKAQQAYCYCRMGDPFNQDHAIDLYIQALQDKNDNQWNYGLGLACMRTIHGSMINHSFKRNINERVRYGANALFEVAERSPDVTLKGQSYMNLALLQSYARRSTATKLCADDYREMFKGLTVDQLIDKAVDLGPNDYKVLADCGRAIADDNKVKAKQLLEKSNQIRRNSKACHQLGFLTNDFVERLSLWFDAIKLSYYSNNAVEKGIQNFLKKQMRGNLLKKCFVRRVHTTPGQKDVLVLAQDNNDIVDKVCNTLTNCFGLETTLCIQIEHFITEVTRHKVVILVVPRVTRRDFTDVIKRIVQMTSQNGTKVKALVPDSTVTIPEPLQYCQPLSMSEIYEHVRPGQVNYHSLLGSYQQMISFIKLFNFITE